ncbi:hypothetical protein J6590_092184 [Homalodisca vitripennis]|nr:hypothetical protein J6590_092184 [Homalodisca vitripennis]
MKINRRRIFSDSVERVGVHRVCGTLYRPLITIQRKAKHCRANRVESISRSLAPPHLYSSPGFPPPPAWEHRSSEAYQCANIQFQDVRRFHQKFYSTPNRVDQNNFILHYITVETPKRKRPRVQDNVAHKKQQEELQHPCGEDFDEDSDTGDIVQEATQVPI